MLEFIKNYTDGLLSRSLRSTSALSGGALNHYPEQDMEDCGQQDVVCVPELNSNSFYNIVMAQNVVSTKNYCLY
jgi:hypothetical protein